MRRLTLHAAAGAVAITVAYVALGALLDAGVLLPTDEGSLAPVAVFTLLPVALLGAALGVGSQFRLAVPTLGTAFGLLWSLANGDDLLPLLVLGGVAVGTAVEIYVRAVRGAIRDVPHTGVTVAGRRAAVVGGVAYLLVNYAILWYAREVHVDSVLLWASIGWLVLGGTAAYLLVRSRLVLPALLLVVDAVFARAAALDPGVGEPYITFHVLLWALTLAVMLVVGGVEYAVRGYFGVVPPQSPLPARE